MKEAIICPHNCDYPLGNLYNGRPISQNEAKGLKPNGRCGQVTSLLYDEETDGFDPRKWQFFNPKESDVRMVLLPPDANGHGEGCIVSVHRSKNEEENKYLLDVTSQFIDDHPPVRNTKEWNGFGKMIGIGEHYHFIQKHCNFIREEISRNLWSEYKERTVLRECGRIIRSHFHDKNVGFGEMIEKQKELWPGESRLSVTE